jgi:Domain of unknown function (DUF4259)
MGVWAAGNFDNDEAMDYVHELVDQMVEQIVSTVASEHGMEPDEPDSFRLMCNVELLWLIGQRVGASLPKSAAVADWKTKYLAVWDEYIDDLDPKPGFKEERRAVITESFDRLISLCRSQEQRQA